MSDADPKKSSTDLPPAPELSVDERLKQLRETASTASEEGFREAFQEASKLEKPRDEKARAKQLERLIPVDQYRERMDRLAELTKKAHTSDPETTALIKTKKDGANMFAKDLPVFLGRVAGRRGIDLEAPGARDKLLVDIIQGAARPLDQGYDPDIPIYDPTKQGFDSDAMQVANIWSMTSSGKKYTTPEELREGLPEDLGELVRHQQNLQNLFDQEKAEGRTERVVGIMDGTDELTIVERTANEDLNTQIARKQPHGAEHTLLLANIDEETKQALRDAAARPPTKEEMDAAGLQPSEQRKIVSLHRMRESARPQDIRYAIDRTLDGSYVVDLGKHYLDLYRARFAALGEQLPDLSFEEKQERSREYANRYVQRMANMNTPVYHPDPEGVFRDYMRDEGLVGTAASGAKALAAALMGPMATPLTDNFMGELLKTQMATLLPPVRVAGTLEDALGDKVRAGEFGFVSRYVSDGWGSRGIDQALRVSPVSEPFSAAYAMALEEVVAEQGTFSGKALDLLPKIIDKFNSDEHRFRIASRDDDMTTMMFTMGRALDPTIALGLRDEPEEPGVIDYMTTIGAALGIVGLMVLEPDLLTFVGGPGVAGLARGARAATLLTKMDGIATIGRGVTGGATYKGLKGRDAVQGLLADVVAGSAGRKEYEQAMDEWARADPLGRGAIGVRTSEMQRLQELGIEAVTPGQVPSISRDVLKTNAETRRAYDAEVAALDKKLDKAQKNIAASGSKNAPEIKILLEEVRQRVSARVQETKAKESLDYSTVAVREAEQRLLDLNNLPTTGPKVDDAVRKGLVDELKGIDLTDEAALIHFLQKDSVQSVMRAGGIDPVEMLGRAQALRQTGELRGVARPAKLRKFAEGMKKSMLGTLSRPMDDAIAVTRKRLSDELGAARKRQATDAAAITETQKRLKALNQSLDKRVRKLELTPKGKKASGKSKRARKQRKLRNLDSMKIDELRKFIEEADAQAVRYTRKAARLAAKRTEAAAQATAAKDASKDFMVGVLTSLLELDEVSSAMGKAAGRIREQFGTALGVIEETQRKQGIRGVEPETAKRAESVLRDVEPLKKMLDDMQKKMTPDEYDAAVARLLQNQLYVNRLYRAPGAVGDLVRAQPSMTSIRGFIQTQAYKAGRLAAKAQGWWDEASQSFSVEMGVLDIKVNQELDRAAAESRIYGRSINGELNAYLDHSPKIEGEKLVDRNERLFLEFMSGTAPTTVTTGLPFRQTINLQSRVMSPASPLDNAIDYFVGAARLITKGDDPDEMFVTMVRSFAKDRLSRDAINNFEPAALLEVSAKLDELVKAETATVDIAKQLPDIIRNAWGRAAPSSLVGFEKSVRNYELFAKTLMIGAAEGYLLKKVAGIAGEKNFLFSPMVARGINNFLDEGLFTLQDAREAIKAGDIVVDVAEVRRFNRVVNKPLATVKGAAVKVADTELAAPTQRKGIVGLYADPRVSTKRPTPKSLKENVRDDNVPLKRDLYSEKYAKGFEVESYRVGRVYEHKGVELVRLHDLSGKYVTTRPMQEVTFRDPIMGFNDALDTVLAMGLSVTTGRSKNAIQAGGTEVKRQYSRLVARSVDAEGNVMYVPRDLSREMYDAIDRLQKDLVDAPVAGRVWGKVMSLANKAMSFYKKTILFGFIIARAAFAPNAFVSDASQMIIDLNGVPLRDILRVSTYGAFGYIPVFGPLLKRGYGVLGKGRQLPSPSSALSDPATRAVMAGTNDLIEIRKNGKVVRTEKARDILRKAYQQGSGDNILSSDDMLALRRLRGQSIFQGSQSGLEILMREGTRSARISLFLNLYAEQGMDAAEAGLRMRQALYNWDDAVGRSELQFLGKQFLFYTYTKNAIAQTQRMLFEGYTDGLDVGLRKFLKGQTKLQRFEGIYRLSSGFFDYATRPDEMSPEEAAAEMATQFPPDYMLSSTILNVDPVPKNFQKYAKPMYGRHIDSIAGMLPKLAHVEMLSHHINLFNATVVPVGLGALNALGVTDYEPDYQAAGLSLARFLEDMANPFSSEVIKAVSAALGIRDPQEGRSDVGTNVRMYEAVLLTHFGLGDGLELQPDDTLRINPDSTSSAVVRTLLGTPLVGDVAIALERQFLLPSYTNARLLDELNGGYVTEASIGLFQALARKMPGIDPYSDIDMQRIRAAPVSVEYTRAQKGWLAAKIQALSQYLGLYKLAVFSGKQTQTFRLRDADQMMSSAISQSRKRARTPRPLPEAPKPEE